MRIGIDARELGGMPTGVGRYLSRLLEAWAQSPSGRAHTFLCYLPAPPPPAVASLLTALGAIPRVVPGSAGTLWEQVQLPLAIRNDRLDVLFAPAYTAPLAVSCPVVVTIHDLSYMARPEWFPPRERWRRSLLTRLGARRARQVLTDSGFSRDEVVRLVGVPQDRITVIPLGLGLQPGPGEAVTRLPLVLYVGSIFNRRRVPDVIAAFAAVAKTRPDVTLELVGENRSWPRQDIDAAIAASGVSSRIRARSWIPDAELTALYARASAFIFLSEYEGFGLTPLEALANGIPAVVLDTPVAREVCGDAALYVQAGDIAGTAITLSMALADQATRASVLSAARERLPRYSWPTTAAATLSALERAAR